MKAFSDGFLLVMVSLVSALMVGCATSQPGGAVAEVAEVRAVNGTVAVQLPDHQTWRPAYAGQLIPAGAVVRTGANATADLRLAKDGPMMRVLPESRAELVRMTRHADGRTHTILNLQTGQAFVDDRSVKPGSRVEVRTAHGVVTVPPK